MNDFQAENKALMHYPFGMLMPGRNFGSDTYRFGFNGQENDDEVKREGSQQDYGFRIYDTRIGKFLSVDPIYGDFPELSTYQFASNTPIMAIDIDGLESNVVITDYTESENKPEISYIFVPDYFGDGSNGNLGAGFLDIMIHKLESDGATLSTYTFLYTGLGNEEDIQYEVSYFKPKPLKGKWWQPTSGIIFTSKFFGSGNGDGSGRTSNEKSENIDAIFSLVLKLGNSKIPSADAGTIAEKIQAAQKFISTISKFNSIVGDVEKFSDLNGEDIEKIKVPFDTVCIACKQDIEHLGLEQITRTKEGETIDTLLNNEPIK